MSVHRMKWLDHEAENFNELVEMVPDDVLASPRRSVVTLLEFCRDTDRALTVLEAACGVRLNSATDLFFEYAVPVQKGRGKPSFTDLLVLSDDAAIGVEAKYTEPEYESVRKWLRDPREANREDVLTGWLNLIGRTSSRSLSVDQVLDVPYQLVHRVASACFPNRLKRAAVYLVFGSHANHYAKHMQAFAALIGGIPALAVVSCTFTPSEKYADLLRRWDRGERQMGKAVRDALCAAPLMSFDDVKIEFASNSPGASIPN